jgi:C1A family cysteine protease
MAHKIPQYGWIPDLPDARDHMYAAPPQVLATLPPQVDLRPHCPPVLDQGNLGSCTANAIANAHLFDQQQQKARGVFLPSRLFIYYNERAMEGTVRVDAGAMIRDGIKSLAQQGACAEKRWPYLIAKFAHKPTKPCYTDAMKHQAVSYQRLVPTLPQLQGCLASGFPFVFGFTVYASFESTEVARTGTVPMPRPHEPTKYRKNKAPFHAVPPARGASAPLPPAGAAAARGGSGWGGSGTTARAGPVGAMMTKTGRPSSPGSVVRGQLASKRLAISR